MKVLVIFPDAISKPVGGLGVQFKNIYERLKKDIDFYIVGQPDQQNYIKNYKHVSHPIPELYHGSINTLLGHTIYLSEALSFPKPDLIHAYDWSTYFAGVYLSQIHDVPLLLTMQLSAHGLSRVGIYNSADASTVDGYHLHRAHEKTEKYALQKSNKIIHVSKGYAEYFKEFENKSVIIPNGIDLKEWNPKNKITLPGNNPHKVVYIGRFSSMKSIEELLDVNIPSNVDLIFVGRKEGGDSVCVKKLDEALINKKPNLYYYGPAFDQEKVDVLHAADAVIMPSKHEPFGIVGLEAFASKSILITSRVDGISDYADDTNSIYCGTTKNEIEKALYEFVELSPNQKNQMIERGLQMCEIYNWGDISKEYLKVYKSFKNEV